MRHVLIAALALALAAPTVRAQTTCRPYDAEAQLLVSYMRRYSVKPTGGDVGVASRLGLPNLSDTGGVKLVTQEATCKKARDAYLANTSGSAAVGPSGRVYVVAIGTTLYAVVDPVYQYSSIKQWSIQILDSRFKLRKFFG